MSGQITVLHVDDEPDFAEMTAEFLTRKDDRIEVVTAAGAREGLATFEAEPIDCVVSDYDMPEMDGLSFLKHLRERNETVPFVLFTGKGSEEVASRAFSAGATDYLQKTGGTDQYAILANRVRKYVERARARRERDRRLEAIETAREGISILDDDGRFVYVNEAYADIYGYDPDEMVGEHWELIYSTDDAKTVRDDILPVVEETGEWEGETVGLRADGTTFVEDHTVSKTADGGFVCTVVDITDRKRRVEEYDRYRTLVEALDDPVYVLDAEGRFQYVNRAFVDLVGYEYERILGSMPDLIKDAAAVERAEEELGSLLSDDGPDSKTFEVEIHPRDGDPIRCEDHMGVVPYEGERFRGSVGVLREVTEQLEREERLERTNERLEEFASIVSHDLRNPLNVAQGRLDLALTEAADGQTADEHLAEAADALDRMERMIAELLTLAKEGDPALDRRPVRLETLVDACWGRVGTDESSVRVADELTIHADEERVRRLFENLFQNALDHGGPAVTIRVGAVDTDGDGGNGAGFYVEDDGPGIPADERGRVFDDGYTTRDEGVGFGLSIVQRIADAHGWDVRVTRGRAGGARFEITGVRTGVNAPADN